LANCSISALSACCGEHRRLNGYHHSGGTGVPSRPRELIGVGQDSSEREILESRPYRRFRPCGGIEFRAGQLAVSAGACFGLASLLPRCCVQHLLLWADYVAPFRVDPEQATNHTLRPAYTLGRAAIEAASQAVWMTVEPKALECTRRHLSLVRWDYEEHRKSLSGDAAKRKVREADRELLDRVSRQFDKRDLAPPGYLDVLRGGLRQSLRSIPGILSESGAQQAAPPTGSAGPRWRFRALCRSMCPTQVSTGR